LLVRAWGFSLGQECSGHSTKSRKLVVAFVVAQKLACCGMV